MHKTTRELLKTHQVIRGTLEHFTPKSPRFHHDLESIQHTVAGHAWFLEQVFLPVLEASPLVDAEYIEGFRRDHRDLEALLDRLRETPLRESGTRQIFAERFKALLLSHLERAEKGLYPLAEGVLEPELLLHLGEELKRRKEEVRSLVGV
jgi:hypothetical protein